MLFDELATYTPYCDLPVHPVGSIEAGRTETQLQKQKDPIICHFWQRSEERKDVLQ
jgi:hypothetical protein